MKMQWNEEAKDSQLEGCLEYFHSNKVFHRMLCGFREKYISYGCFSGIVVLKSLKKEDVEVLEGFLSKSFHGQKSVSVSADNFKKALKNSCFDQIEPKELLERYFGEELAGKKQLIRNEAEKWMQIFEAAENKYRDTPAAAWIRDIMNEEKSSDWRKYLSKTYRDSGKDWDAVDRLLKLGADIINAFPYRNDRLEYLAVFAALLTGNPHAFDDGEKHSRFLEMLICWDVCSRKQEVDGADIFPAVSKKKLYLKVGILRDDISNYAMLSGVRAWKKDGNPHSGMDGFAHEGDMVHIPLNVITGWERVSCPDNEIYIVENPSIYAMLCSKWKGKRAFMCMNGQPRLGSVLVLDLLAEAGVKIYYAGDFDPEGLLIAQKIRAYYRGKFEYWQMTSAVYELCQTSERISEKRLKMLDNITDADLIQVADSIKEKGLAGYQENVWERYLQISKQECGI